MNNQLKLTIGGQVPALPPDAGIVLRKSNRLLAERSEEATYPFTLPLGANRAILGYPDRPANNLPAGTLPASASFGPFGLLSGIAVMTGCTSADAEIYLSSGQRSFWNRAKTTLLTDAFPRPDNSHAAATASLVSRKPAVACTLWNSAAKTWINPYAGGTLQNQYGNTMFPRLGEVLRSAISSLGYTPDMGYLGGFPSFADILIVYLGYADTGKAVLPAITAEELITEVENRFGVWLDVDESRRTAVIRSMNQFPEQPLFRLRAFYNPEITFLEESEYRVRYVFADSGTDDEFVKKWHSSFSVGSGDEIKTECISSQIGSTVVEGRTVGAVSSGVADAGDFTPSKDFRLALYQGIQGGVPLMNNRGLEWDYLYATFHRLRTEMLLTRRRTVTFAVDADDIRCLAAWKDLFNGYVAVNGCRYLAVSGEMNLSGSRIGSFELEAVPV